MCLKILKTSSGESAVNNVHDGEIDVDVVVDDDNIELLLLVILLLLLCWDFLTVNLSSVVLEIDFVDLLKSIIPLLGTLVNGPFSIFVSSS